jgi:hypothetical protein
MPNPNNAAVSAGQEPSRSRNWSLIVGRVALVWALVEALMAGLANMSGGSLLGVNEQHFSLDAIVAALVGIGFVLDGSARRLARDG